MINLTDKTEIPTKVKTLGFDSTILIKRGGHWYTEVVTQVGLGVYMLICIERSCFNRANEIKCDLKDFEGSRYDKFSLEMINELTGGEEYRHIDLNIEIVEKHGK
jgi:hypothetical protein